MGGTGRALAWRAAALMARLAPAAAERRLSRPAFIVTAGRSGSSFLTRALADLPELAVYPSEANRLWHPNAYPRRRFSDELPDIWQAPRRFTELSLARRTAADGRRLRANFGAYQALTRGRVLVAKSAMIQFMLPWVCSQFPDGRFIHLVRDGRAVVLSYGKRMMRLSGAGAGERPSGELLRTLARYWCESLAAVWTADDELGLERDDRLLEVRYETLCTDPAGELARLASYLGVARAAGAAAPAAFESTNWKSERELPTVVAEELSAIMRDGLNRYGYR
jgi:hypothetical protein